jgi:hypothetical protein
MPFANPMERAIHFWKHGAEFGCKTDEDYERLADSFLFGAMSATTRECWRPNGVDRLRFNSSNRHFGVACIAPVFIRTFYQVGIKKVAKHGGVNGFLSYECARLTA